MRPTHAMLLAAGRGERFRPLTDTIPKPLVKVAGRSLIDRQLDRLEDFGIERVIVNTSYLAPALESHLSHRDAPPIHFSREPEAMETGGGVYRALPRLGAAPFFVMNSDVVLLDGCIPALARLADAWSEEADVLLLLHPREKAYGYQGKGDFFFEPGGAVRRRGGSSEAPYVFSGTQILHPRVFAAAPSGAFSLNWVYDRRRRADGTLDDVRAVIHDGDWLHVGDMAGLRTADDYFQTAVNMCPPVYTD